MGFSEERTVNEQIEHESDAEEDLIMYPATDTYQNLTYKVSKEYLILKAPKYSFLS